MPIDFTLYSRSPTKMYDDDDPKTCNGIFLRPIITLVVLLNKPK